MTEPAADEPVICDGLLFDDDNIVPCKSGESPVIEIKFRWRKIKKSEQDSFMKDPRWSGQIRVFLEELNTRPFCVDPFDRERRGRNPCTCMRGIFTDNNKESVADEALKFALFGLSSDATVGVVMDSLCAGSFKHHTSPTDTAIGLHSAWHQRPTCV